MVELVEDVDVVRRAPLSRDRVLGAAVALADDGGIESLSMRRLAGELGVVPMALYKHVTNKEQLLDGMLDVIVGAIDPPAYGTDWKSAVRQRILATRRSLLRHPWAFTVIESRTTPTPVVMQYLESIIGTFRTGGFSVDLTHHVMHALGSRVWGFTRELFVSPSAVDPQLKAAMLDDMAATYPFATEIAIVASHDDASVVGPGCDDQFEFEFALDLLLDGFERLEQREGRDTHAPHASP